MHVLRLGGQEGRRERTPLDDLLVQGVCILVLKRKEATDHCKERDAGGPDVDGVADVALFLALAREHLRRGVARRAASVLEHLPGAQRVDSPKSTIRMLRSLSSSRFSGLISRWTTCCLQILHTVDDLVEEPPSLVLAQPALLDDVLEELALGRKLHDEVDTIGGVDDLPRGAPRAGA